MTDSSEINCTAPSLRWSTLGGTTITPERPVLLSYGFKMDNVTELLNLTRRSGGRHIFVLYPDPYFQPLDEEGIQTFQLKNEYLTINVSICTLLFSLTV